MRLTLVTKEGTVLSTWELDEWDLSKPMAQTELIAEIEHEVGVGKMIELQEEVERNR